MSTKTTLAAIAALVTVMASPAFAGDQDLVTELQDSGRYYGVDYTANPLRLSGAYASVKAPRARAHNGAIPAPERDFQLQGRF